MSEPSFESEPPPFNFSDVAAEEIPAFTEPDPPDVKASKPRWWQGVTKSKSEKANEPKKRGRPSATMTDAALKRALENFYSGMSMFVMPFCPHCAQVVGNSATEAADAMVEWSKTNPAIRRFLVNMVSISAGGKVLAIHSAMLMPIAMHHVPVLRERQERMVSQVAEAFTRAAAENTWEEES